MRFDLYNVLWLMYCVMDLLLACERMRDVRLLNPAGTLGTFAASLTLFVSQVICTLFKMFFGCVSLN